MAAERDGRGCELPIAPGQVYIEVEYDYNYKSKERQVSIHQGECYMLVKKTNGDWWQVKKEEGAKAFYVPAQYVREVRKALMPPPKPLHLGHHRGGSGGNPVRVKPIVLEMDRSNESLNVTSFSRPSPSSPSPSSSSGAALTPPRQRRDRDRDANQNPGRDPGSPTDYDRALVDVLQNTHAPGRGCNTLPRARATSPELRRAPLDVDMPPGHCDSEGSERRNDSESGDELSSGSSEHLQTVSLPGQGGRPESPVYTNLQELKISGTSLPSDPSNFPQHVLGDWEAHKDQSGRQFYFNRSTQERTWKPPRARDASSGSSRGESHSNSTGETETTPPLSLSPSFLPLLSLSIGPFQPLLLEDNCHSTYSSQSDSQYGYPPRGWSEELDEHGHTLYVSDYTNEKYQHSPPLPGGGDRTPKSHSLDRKHVEPIVLTKWANSSNVLDANDKRLIKNIRRFRTGSGRPHPYRQTQPSEKCGILNVTKITEHGKKVRKNWTSSWTVLQGSSLIFAKGQGGGSSWFGGNQSKPEFTVDLRGGSIEWASKDKSSKKHVIEVKTHQSTELLIQSENDGVINDWYRALMDTISTHAWESDEALEEDMPESPGAEKQDKEKEHRDSKKSRAMKSSTSMDASDNKKTRIKLKKFLTRRPTLQTVRDKGYIKDQVFGCSLSDLCHRENTAVPSFVTMCIDHVENNALNVDGLYRVSGNLAVIQKLRFAVNHDEKVNLEEGKWEDIHVITGALKMFFRELPEPLFTYGLFHDFVNSIKIPDNKQRVQSIKERVKQLPKPNQDTMQVLFKHLRRVIDHSEENRMTTQSVAIVFGPTLLRPETETWNMAVHMVYQNQIVELILLEYEGIFR
ncbi:rho GTPase-activating protein 12 isoform X3 [Oncorhynchus kisutch]|uniref:rho GTPase-activating protein 12 isoform X3 n=1 Tax=Oncorhynchus kisutch TaxID=8019 RepID=UPI0012DCD0E7|nr:rho GTPase-activating protein 12 isoform X3 [Oncorhynchus kisutch]